MSVEQTSLIPEEAIAPMQNEAKGELMPASQLPAKTPAWGVGDSWLAEYERIAVRVADSVVLPDSLRGNPRNVLAVALAGRELGIGFMEATRQIDIIKGTTALRTELKMALAKRAGLVVDELEATDTGCRIKAHMTETGEALEVSFTDEDRKRAGLDGVNWEHYPQDMFYARAASRLVRRLAPHARGASFYSIEELTDEGRVE